MLLSGAWRTSGGAVVAVVEGLAKGQTAMAASMAAAAVLLRGLLLKSAPPTSGADRFVADRPVSAVLVVVKWSPQSGRRPASGAACA